MPFEPDKITQAHIKKAAAKIKSKGLPLIPSTGYDAIIDGDPYPPKEIMRHAHKQMNGEFIWHYGGGNPTNKYLERLGFEVIEKSSTQIKALIKEYKKRIQQNKLEEEIYKWELVKQFQGRPNLNALDFFEEMKSINYANLIFSSGLGVIRMLAKERPHPYRACFQVLFNEGLPLQDRLNRFTNETLRIYREIEPNKKYSHHHDERTMATFLAFFSPDKYAFFKDSFYQKYCKLLGVEAKNKDQKYVHYLELLDSFISDYIEPDTELVDAVNKRLHQDAFPDTNHKILAQDILYTTLDKGMEEIDIGNAAVYKISMGDFLDQEIEACITQHKVLVHQNTKAKGVSKDTQGDVFTDKINTGDYFYLTHGNKPNPVKLLGRITGDATYAAYNDLGAKGWLERPFEVIAWSKNKMQYKRAQKWWTPNNNSTCIGIKEDDLEEANKLLFIPYFMAKLVPGESGDIVEEPEILTDDNFNRNNMPLNQILFGPPGTGKTFNTINKALQVLGEDINGKDRSEIKKAFDEKVKEGQIVFTTFHQSMSYEDFIEGIKPITPDKEGDPVIYKVEEGIFRRLCIEASFSLAKENDSIETENVLDFSLAYDNFVQRLEERLANEPSVDLPIKNGGTITVEGISPQGNIVIKHIGGARSYVVSKTRLSKLQKSITNLNDISNINSHFRAIIGGLNASAYWAVLNAIRKEKQPNQVKTEARNFTWEEKKEVVQSLKTQDFKNKQGKPHILIIDEINRGNVSQIFGELITLIEEDKRLGRIEALEVTLPYSKETFGVPANLYIIGTMNTADRSVEALDTALRRRFSFVEMPPQYDLSELAKEVEDYKLSDILKKINRRIEKLLGQDNLIGHSYFLEVKDAEGLRIAFQNKIIPLLQEYFYGDYGKIGLVLGEGFFKEAEEEEDDIFASFSRYDSSGLAEKEVYHLQELVGVGRLSDADFKAALDVLMK